MTIAEYRRPLLQKGQCIAADYGVEWVEQVLCEAAREAGVSLPYSREVAEGIMKYLDEWCNLPTLPLEYFFARVRSLLREIGLPLVAEHLHAQTPPVDIELDELAKEEPLPLFFYTKLSERMEELRSRGVNVYHFSGAHRCSLVLGGRRRSCPTQRRALSELRKFIAARAA